MSIRRNLQRYISLYDYVSAYRTNFDHLELENAVSDKFESLNLYGKCIENILLPEGYTEVEYVTNNANTCVDTGIITDVDDLELEIKIKPTSSDYWYIFQNRNTVDNDIIHGLHGVKTGSTIGFRWEGESNAWFMFDFNTTRDSSCVYTIHGKFYNKVWSGWVRNDTNDTLEIATPVSYDSFKPNDLSLLIFGNQRNNYVSSGNSVYYIKIYKSGKLVRYLIPAIDSNNQSGFYDIVQYEFLTANVGSLIAGPVKTIWKSDPDMPIDIVCNCGAIKGISKNLFNLTPGNITLGYYISPSTGQEIPSLANYFYNAYIPIKSNTSYVFFGRRKSDNRISNYNRIAWYDSNFQWISNCSYTQNTVTIARSPSNAKYARLHCNVFANVDIQILYSDLVKFNWMFYEGDAEEPFVPNGIVTNDDKESVIVTGKNLYDKNKIMQGYIDGNGSLINSTTYGHSDLIPVEIDSSYVFSGVRVNAVGNKRIHGYDSNGNWVQQLAINPYTSNAGGYCLNVTIPLGIKYIVMSGMRIDNENADENVQFEKSTRPTKYENYTKCVYSIPPLLSIDDIKDTLDLKSGLFNHKVTIKVLTGTENWVLENNVFCLEDNAIPNILLPNDGIICTHFTGRIPSSTTISNIPNLGIKWGSSTTNKLYIRYDKYSNVNDFKEWLASEYSAGIPVIILYPTNIEVKESLGEKGIYTVTGTNFIERIGHGIDVLEMDSVYKKLR